jgi:hypothetical protein
MNILFFWLAFFSFIMGSIGTVLVIDARTRQTEHRLWEDLKDARTEILRLRAQVAAIIGRST